jgi:hypothetical protein
MRPATQFSLLSVLACIAIVSVILSLWKRGEQARAITNLTHEGGSVVNSGFLPEVVEDVPPNGPVWTIYFHERVDRRKLERLIPEIAVFPLVDLAFGDAGFGDAGMASIARLRNLHLLCLTGPRMDDRAISNIVEMPTLRAVMLDQCNVTAQGISVLSRLPELEILVVINMSIDADSLYALAETCSRLRVLVLEGEILERREDGTWR